jgi:hypothetical protein
MFPSRMPVTMPAVVMVSIGAVEDVVTRVVVVAAHQAAAPSASGKTS